LAKFKYSMDISDMPFHIDNLTLAIRRQGERAIWTDSESQTQIIFEGKGLKASGEIEEGLRAGSIKSIRVVDDDGHTLVSVTGLHAKASKLMAQWEEGNFEGAMFYLARGKDHVIGSKGDDSYLLSGAGDDVMTGRGGADIFAFQATPGPKKGGEPSPQYDIITDFVAVGEDHDFLLIYDEYTFKGVHKGRDTLVTLEDGSHVLLEHVTKAEFQVYYDGLSEL